METTCTSWLHGRHSENVEIDTKIPYVSIYNHFAQGDEAEGIIYEINQIYNSEDLTPLKACEKWASIYLY
jgi:hypothetical protein